MNNTRRKSLQSILDQLEELKAILEDIQAEEEECRDNIPENMRNSDRYDAVDTACDNLSDAINSLDDAISSIDDAAS